MININYRFISMSIYGIGLEHSFVKQCADITLT